MTIEEQLRNEILNQYGSVRAFTNKIGISYSTIDSALKRGISKAGVSTMIRVFQELGLDIENIQRGDLYYSAEKESATTGKVAALLSMYDQLNTEGQEKLLDYADDLVRSEKYIKNDTNGLADESQIV